ncbi:MAG: PEP-CTERM sorting domain-containing protein, partial [Planctomycetes bacterium]|nr:PEP-CTERM sorting domain-containing protein [Planctomycetota bacterium]
GNAANVDPSAGSHWVIASASSGLVNPENLTSSVIHLAVRNGTGGFTNPVGSGGFSLMQGGSLGNTNANDVVLVYYVPEPAPVALVALAAAGILVAARRRRAA